MVRSLGGLAVITLALLLTACTAPAPSGSPETPRAAASATDTPTEAPPTLDGDWISQVADPSSTCIGIGYRILHIDAGVASTTTTFAGATTDTPPVTGPAVLSGSSATINLARSTPTKDVLDITGVLGEDGLIRGTANASGIHPGGQNGYTCSFDVTLVPAIDPETMPTFDSIDGTWCAAEEPASCMTIAGGKVGSGEGSADETIQPPSTGDGFGAPCYRSAVLPAQPPGGFAIYYCPAGVAVVPGGGGIPGEIVAPLDDVAFDRIYGTQNPPYLNTYFREKDLATALAQ